MTRFRLKSDPTGGHVAIYSIPTADSLDNEPLYDPFSFPGRLQFHSGMHTPSTTPELTQTVTVSVPTQAAQTKYSGQINLFAHGKGEPCMVEGAIKGIGTGGADVAFNGTVPVNVTATGHATWLALGSNNTHVVVVYFGITSSGFTGFALDIEASAYDFLASGSAPAANPSLPLIKHVPTSYTQLGRGSVDTRRRYLRKVATGGDFALAVGPTLSIVGVGITAAGSYVQNEIGWRWRYSCAGYVRQTTQAWNGTTTDGGSRDAPHILVKR